MPNNVGMEQNPSICRAIEIAGGLGCLAVLLGVKSPSVHEWKTGKRSIPIERCVQIERATNGAVTRKDLRPDDWADIWPELAQVPASVQEFASETVAGV